jgi:hypothetical protein
MFLLKKLPVWIYKCFEYIRKRLKAVLKHNNSIIPYFQREDFQEIVVQSAFQESKARKAKLDLKV